jgi:1-acyl-sn-glycerol-3-phosphate acyltransferase/CRP-like cAMP-binding protein
VTAERTELLAVVEAAPFTEGLLPEDRAELVRHARLVDYEPGRRIVTEGEPGTTFAILVSGQVRLSFAVKGGAPAAGDPLLQTVRHPGSPIGWSSMVPPHVHRATATACAPTRLLVIEREDLERLVAARPTLGVVLMRAILGLLGDRLRVARMRLVARRYDDEVAAVRVLLAENAGALPVTSPLHKLPHYLQHRLTLDDAFHTIELLQVQGNPVERELAAECAVALGNARRQLELYQRLQAVYETVASAPADVPPEEIRARSMHGFQRVFALVAHRIEGLEHLPDRPGHVFVMNHLGNHPDNLLANEFNLTLDTHFVASMILFERYGAAPVRVIRRSRPAEQGHQRYFDRLGYVYADPVQVDGGAGLAARQHQFFAVAGAHLLAGRNVIICPEGTSTSTEASPLRFRPGAFQLAASTRPEPLIVPIAVANLDKRLTRTTAVAVVHEPFKVSAVVADPSDRDALLTFLNDDLVPRFRGWVRDAAALAG